MNYHLQAISHCTYELGYCFDRAIALGADSVTQGESHGIITLNKICQIEVLLLIDTDEECSHRISRMEMGLVG